MKLPKYRPAPGVHALTERLLSLTTACRPAACPVHVGLGAPVANSTNLGHITYGIARELVNGTAHLLPSFNTFPRPERRVLDAASWDRIDATSAEFAQMPADLATELWHQVDQMCRDRGSLTPAERCAASDLLLRLGYPLRAGEIFDLLGADLADHPIHPETVRSELAVLLRLYPDAHPQLEEWALRGAANSAVPPQTRVRLANYVVVSNGKRGTDVPALHRAAEFGRDAMAEITGTGMDRYLTEHTLYRAIAYEPYLRRDMPGTMELLDRAAVALAQAEPATGPLEILSWKDHAFPMFETLSKTLLGQGEVGRALESTGKLIEISPYDHRVWELRAHAFVASGNLGEAVSAWEQILPQGGLPVASAAFYLGWAHHQLGDTSSARDYYTLSQAVDPTSPELAEHMAILAKGNGVR
ncbi:tetratricopeptide repeat protein [Micromonospora sp. NPDC050417]|uniref:tetratricopeptide repeat protein n=1 Tax=Micromonospora sp. NPDC050417 TaxID=3364280 RepID=UPI0037B002E2